MLSYGFILKFKLSHIAINNTAGPLIGDTICYFYLENEENTDLNFKAIAIVDEATENGTNENSES